MSQTAVTAAILRKALSIAVVAVANGCTTFLSSARTDWTLRALGDVQRTLSHLAGRASGSSKARGKAPSCGTHSTRLARRCRSGAAPSARLHVASAVAMRVPACLAARASASWHVHGIGEGMRRR
eukprot:804121-Pleurochrysis_carterae.AAC.1